jgi:hypothetical protein
MSDPYASILMFAGFGIMFLLAYIVWESRD